MANDRTGHDNLEDSQSERRALSGALREAYAGSERPGECPPVERWIEWAEGRLDEGEAEALDRHAEVCGVCLAEARLAKAFAEDDSAVSDLSVRRIVRDLERRSPLRRRARVVPLLAAAAAALLVAVGLANLTSRQQPLPEPADLTIVRGAALQWETVLGEETLAPVELRWTALEAADRYRIEIVRVDDTEVWQQELSDVHVFVPEEVREELEPFVRYRALVTALDPDGNVLSRSSPLAFSLRENLRE